VLETVDLPEKVLKKLIDLVPRSKEEFTSILSSYGIIISEKDLNTLLSYFELL
jgi:DNA-directed RNA polymerase subunit F